jgi:hypothetical protein
MKYTTFLPRGLELKKRRYVYAILPKIPAGNDTAIKSLLFVLYILFFREKAKTNMLSTIMAKSGAFNFIIAFAAWSS